MKRTNVSRLRAGPCEPRQSIDVGGRAGGGPYLHVENSSGGRLVQCLPPSFPPIVTPFYRTMPPTLVRLDAVAQHWNPAITVCRDCRLPLHGSIFS